MNMNILGTKVHVVLVFVGALCVLLLFGCIGVISWGGWKMNQQDEATKKHSEETADLKNLKTENEKSQNETKKLSSQLENLNETLQGETEKLIKKVENLNEKSQNETEKLSQIILLILKFNLDPVAEHCDSKECLLCQTGWIFFNESCYFISDGSLSWDESRRFCQLKSADLIVINNQQEQEFIYYKLNTNTYYWLGLRNNGSNWVWIDGRIDTLRFWSPSYQYSPYSYAYMYQTGNLTASWGSASYTYTYQYGYQYYTHIYPRPLCEQKAFKVSLN